MSRTDDARVGAMTTFILCFLAALIEGYDLQSAGVAAPKFAPAFGLAPADLGWVFSSNTLGLFFGAAIGGWLSDRFGRKGVLIVSLITFGLFSIGTALATDVTMLLAMRFLTGLGLGGAFPNLIAIVAETGDERGRATRVTMIAAGMPIGGVLANLFVLATPDLDWSMVFHVGGVAPILLGLVMTFALTESAGYLAAKAPENATAAKTSPLAALLTEGRALTTVMLWVSFFCTLVVLYLLLNWLPSLMVSRGFSRPDATLVALAFSLGGATGALVLGYLIGRGPRRLILTLTYVGMAGGLLALAMTPGLAGAAGAALVAGFFVIGAQFVLYGFSPVYYPTSVRGTGVGAAVAVGRLGAVAGPMLAGAVLASGHNAGDVMMVLLPLILVAYGAVFVLLTRPTAE